MELCEAEICIIEVIQEVWQSIITRKRLFYENVTRHFECTVHQVSSVVSRVKFQRTVVHLGVQIFIGKGADFNSIIFRLILIGDNGLLQLAEKIGPLPTTYGFVANIL